MALAVFNPWRCVVLGAMSRGCWQRWRRLGLLRMRYRRAPPAARRCGRALRRAVLPHRVEGAFVALVLRAVRAAPVAERRWALFALCLLVFGAPEAVHVAYLRAIAVESKASSPTSTRRGALQGVPLLRRHVAAPARAVLDDLPLRHRVLAVRALLPPWLTVAQGVVTVLYLAGWRRRWCRASSPSAATPSRWPWPARLRAAALPLVLRLRALRLPDLPGGGVVFAAGIDSAARWARPGSTWASCGPDADLRGISGAYGVQSRACTPSG
jgi:hypothetical protein